MAKAVTIDGITVQRFPFFDILFIADKANTTEVKLIVTIGPILYIAGISLFCTFVGGASIFIFSFSETVLNLGDL